MSRLTARMDRLEHTRNPFGWCCSRVAEHCPNDDAPPMCPHGRPWLVVLTADEREGVHPTGLDADGRYWFTLTIDRANQPGGDDDDARPPSSIT